MAGFPLLTFCRGFSSCCRAILLTPMEHDRSPPPCCASPRIGERGSGGDPPVLPCGQTARLSPGADRRGSGIPPPQAVWHPPLEVRDRRSALLS